MLPAILDIENLRVGIVGGGARALARLQMVTDAGGENVFVYAEAADDAMRALAGARLVERLPDAQEVAACHILYIADIDVAQAEGLVQHAREVGTLVNVEDVRALCDFHVPSMVRRGDLLLTVSTGGESPALAVRVREKLESLFPESWRGRLEIIGAARRKWRREGADMKELRAKTDALLDKEGWLR